MHAGAVLDAKQLANDQYRNRIGLVAASLPRVVAADVGITVGGVRVQGVLP